MKHLIEYINENEDYLKKIDTFRKAVLKKFGNRIEIQNHGGRFDKYWDILIHQVNSVEDLETLNDMIKTYILPNFDSNEHLDGTPKQLYDRISNEGDTYLYWRFSALLVKQVIKSSR